MNPLCTLAANMVCIIRHKVTQGARQFLLRGQAAVEAEWRMLGAAFNLRVLARLWQKRPALLALGSTG